MKSTTKILKKGKETQENLQAEILREQKEQDERLQRLLQAAKKESANRDDRLSRILGRIASQPACRKKKP